MVLCGATWSCDSVDELSDYNTVSEFRITSHSPSSVEIGEPVIVPGEDNDPDQIRIPVMAGELPLNFKVEADFEKKISEIVGADLSQEQTIKDYDDYVSFVVVAISGMPRRYDIIAVPSVFYLPASIEFTVKSISPANTDMATTAVYNDGELFITVTDPVFPVMLVPEFTLDADKYGCEGFVNGTSELKFTEPGTELSITFVDKVHGTKAVVPVKLDVKTNEGPEGFEVLSFSISSFSSTFKAVDVYIDREAGAGSDEGEITVTLEQPGSCPVTMNYSMTLSRNAAADVDERGKYVFNSLNDVMEFTVTAADATEKKWTVKFADFKPQLKGADLDNWTSPTWSDYYLYPVPTGTKTSPYWANANMNVLAKVSSTRRIASPSGKANDYAALMSTEMSTGVARKASGSLYVGWFDTDNALLYGLSDSKRLTHMGIPFASTHKITGVMVDLSYTSGISTAEDTGSLAVELVKVNTPGATLEYHSNGHKNNNGTLVAEGRRIVGNIEVGQTANNGDKVDLKVTPGQWVKDVVVPLEVTGSYPAYSHISVVFSSSSQGDDLNKAVLGSQLVIDNVRILYED